MENLGLLGECQSLWKYIIDVLDLLSGILLFAAGYYLNRFIEKRKETKKNNDRRLYLKQSLAELKSAVLAQSEVIDETFKALNTKYPESFNRFRPIVTFHVKRIKDIPSTDLFNLLVLESKLPTKDQIYLDLNKSLDLIEQVGPILSKEFDQSYHLMTTKMTELHNTIDEIENFMLMKQDVIRNLHDQLAVPDLVNIMWDYKDSENKNILHIVDNIFLKRFEDPIIIALCSSDLKIGLNFYNYVLKLKSSYENYQLNKDIIVDYCQTISIQLRDLYKLLETINFNKSND